MYVLYFVMIIELQKANSSYEEKLSHGHTQDQTMFGLSWDIEELKSINAECRTLYREVQWCIDFCSPELFCRHNVPRKLTEISQSYLTFLEELCIFREVLPHMCLCLWSAQRLTTRNLMHYQCSVYLMLDSEK